MTSPVALAYTGPEVCGNGGSGYCLNDWNGNETYGNPIKMYYGGYSNEHMQPFYVNECNGNHVVTHTCPFTHTNPANEFYDHSIIAVGFVPDGSSSWVGCIGDNNGDGYVDLTNCPAINGGGGEH